MSDILAVSGSPPPPTSYHLGADLPAFLSIHHESETQRVLGVDISGHKDLEYVMDHGVIRKEGFLGQAPIIAKPNRV